MYNSLNPLIDSLYGVQLLIRINDDTPGNGNGTFNFRIKAWKSSIILSPPIPALPVACQPIANNLEGL
jgi:hypothetical protein